MASSCCRCSGVCCSSHKAISATGTPCHTARLATGPQPCRAAASASAASAWEHCWYACATLPRTMLLSGWVPPCCRGRCCCVCWRCVCCVCCCWEAGVCLLLDRRCLLGACWVCCCPSLGFLARPSTCKQPHATRSNKQTLCPATLPRDQGEQATARRSRPSSHMLGVLSLNPDVLLLHTNIEPSTHACRDRGSNTAPYLFMPVHMQDGALLLQHSQHRVNSNHWLGDAISTVC